MPVDYIEELEHTVAINLRKDPHFYDPESADYAQISKEKSYMPFANPQTKSYNDTRKRSSSDYIRFTPKYKVVVRILNDKAKLVRKHWVSEANNGRGIGFVCPGQSVCPIDIEIKDLDRDDPDRVSRVARKKYLVNVLDRTPHWVCPECSTKTPGKNCINCNADQPKKVELQPLNKIKILESGPRLFEEDLNAIESLQEEELQANITQYDIVFSTIGEGRDRKIVAHPQGVSELDDEDFLDPLTGERQQFFDLELLATPATKDEIEVYLNGGGILEANALKGIA